MHAVVEAPVPEAEPGARWQPAEPRGEATGAGERPGACYPATPMFAPSAPPRAGSPRSTALLAVDAGSVFTKAYLLDDVEGERRLVAVSRVPSTGDDGAVATVTAAQRATAQVLAIAGREADPRGLHARLTSRPGVPRFLPVAPGAEALHALRALLERLPVQLLEPLALDAGSEALLSAVEVHQPDAVIVTAGTTGGAGGSERRATMAVLEALRHGAGDWTLPVVVLASGQVAADAGHALGGAPHAVVEPQDAAGLARELARIGAERAQRTWTEETLSSGAPAVEAAPASSLVGVCAATEMIADHYDVDVLTLDLGASHALAVLATGTSGRRRVVCAARGDLGTRLGRRSILDQAGAQALGSWLPVDHGEEGLRTDARRALVAPAGLPESIEELLAEHAAAREALRLVIADLAVSLGATQAGLPPVDLLIGSGGALACVPRLVQAALILLDAAQPQALTQLALDRATALPLLGHLWATLRADAVGAALERDGLLNLGLCVAPIGAGREGETAVKVEVAYATRSPITVEVPFGAIEVVPLPIGERASLKLWPSRDFDIGLGRGNAATPRAEVEGGAVGIIIDARGRPLQLPATVEKRQAKLLQWLQSTHAYPPLSFVQGQSGSAPGAADLASTGKSS
ncbi:MAG: hypothetical protein AVDCRST_MAG77-2509 [uncultured Chloroflexi bacterium]|uniref:Methylaspartate mutase n=1 Tax=uncultured Chloroflexota bacterium TaxID=166587 RepID=A0A6J4ISL6_9CHLR|nr:MAG: hypothetical protein AVDCRST_MAG77-2509 [uncultured Chloroflexota bacterium]